MNLNKNKIYVIVLLVIFNVASFAAHSDTICVDNTAGLAADLDSAGCAETCDGTNDCNIRDAIAEAEGHVGTDTIIFDPTVFPSAGTTIINTDTELLLEDTVAIQGPGATALVISGNGTDEVFRIFGIASDGTFAISDMTIAGGTLGIFVNDATDDILFDSLIVKENTEDGGIFILSSENSVTTISNCQILNNFSSFGGGVVADTLDSTASVHIEGSVISGNSVAGDVGGGLYDFGSIVTIANTTISNNSADNGGGIYADSGSTLTITNTHILNNTATGELGGGMLISSSDHTVETSVTIASTVFSGNYAEVKGGAISFDGDNDDTTMTTLAIADSTFSANQSGNYAGAMYLTLGMVTITESTLDGNNTGFNSDDEGGAIGNDSNDLTITNSTISNNTSGGNGSALYNVDGDSVLNITNSTISGNVSNTSGGAAVHNGSGIDNMITLLNVTITNNQSNGVGGNGGGISQDSNAGTFTVTNSIIAGNFVNDVANDCFTEGTAITSGGHNILGSNENCADGTFDVSLNDQVGTLGSEVDPLLDAMSPTNGGDPANGIAPATHTPQVASTAIDAADDADAPDEDQRGVSRPIDGDNNGTATADIGAVEAGCGDGVIQTGEECDDAGESINCNSTCTEAACGDGVTNTTAGEECDDAGESVDCNNTCTEAACGDSVFNSTAGEACEDGNTTDGDGCDTSCQVEDSLADALAGDAVCGDGILQTDETCEDGNTDDGDGCDSTCQTEDALAGDAVCGDGILQTDETCEDGNTDDGDGCDSTCQTETSSSGGCNLTKTNANSMALPVILLASLAALGGLKRHLHAARDECKAVIL